MKALVLFSGGLDSSVCLGLAVQAYGPDEVLALSISYGQKHKKEMEASEKVAAFYGVRRVTLDLGEIFKDSTCTLLEGASEEIPHEEYAEQLSKTGGAPVSTYVPFRNGLFLSSAAAVAISQTPRNPHTAVRIKRNAMGNTSVPKKDTSKERTGRSSAVKKEEKHISIHPTR